MLASGKLSCSLFLFFLLVVLAWAKKKKREEEETAAIANDGASIAPRKQTCGSERSHLSRIVGGSPEHPVARHGVTTSLGARSCSSAEAGLVPPSLSEARAMDQRCSAELLLERPVPTETLFGLWISVALMSCLNGRFLLRHFSGYGSALLC